MVWCVTVRCSTIWYVTGRGIGRLRWGGSVCVVCDSVQLHSIVIGKFNLNAKGECDLQPQHFCRLESLTLEKMNECDKLISFLKSIAIDMNITSGPSCGAWLSSPR